MEFQLPDLNRSEFIRSVRFLTESGGLPAHLSGNTRRLTAEEIVQLEANGNVCDDWSRLTVAHNFSPARVYGAHFVGSCTLGHFGDMPNAGGLPRGIWHSTIQDAVIGDACAIHRCPLVSQAIVDRGVTAVGSTLTGHVPGLPPDTLAETPFGVGTRLVIGAETGGREIAVYPDLDPEVAERILELPGSDERDAILPTYERYVADHRRYAAIGAAYVGPRSQIENATVRASWLGPGSVVSDGAVVVNSTILGSPTEPVRVTAASVDTSLVQWGTTVSSGARVHRALLMEYTAVESFARVTESIIAPNASIGSGEVTASYVGPFVAAHHQSLCIAAYWPGGRGNIGYGANVGSNHTSRAPDQYIVPGEGMFFGLDCAVKFPANLSAAPYSVVATSVVLPPHRLETPFSLIVADTHNGAPATRLVPAWMITHNMYALVRMEQKFVHRNRAKRTIFATDLFRAEIRALMEHARAMLAQLGPAAEASSATAGAATAAAAGAASAATAASAAPHPEAHRMRLGPHVILERDRRAAIDAYTRMIRFGELRAATGERNLTTAEVSELMPLVQRVFDDTVRSRQRDMDRGTRIHDDYPAMQPPLAADSVITTLHEELAALAQRCGVDGVPSRAILLDHDEVATV